MIIAEVTQVKMLFQIAFLSERVGMPEQRLPMRKIRGVLRLSANGLAKRKIAASV